jgi:hypothetical protein
VDGVAVAALGELIATAIATAAGRTWKALKGKPEGRALGAAINGALICSLRDSMLPVGTTVDDAWLDEVASVWRPAFTSEVLSELTASLANPPGNRFAQLARYALENEGCDLAMLGKTFWVEEFLTVLPRRFFTGLLEASLQDERVRGLVNHLLRQRSDARAVGD